MDIDVSSLAKLLADRYGHGMSEKCETQAEVILEVVGERIQELEAENQELKNYIGYHLSGEQKECIKELEAHLGEAKREAENLAMYLYKNYYKKDSPRFELCDSVAGVISQIDNMTTGLVKRPTEQSLAAIQREAIEKAIDAAEDYDGGAGMITRFMTEYAEQLTKESE